MRTMTAGLAMCISLSAQAQSWDVDMGAGINYAKLMPVNHSTKQTKNLRYAFMGPNLYINPELSLNMNEHNKLSFGINMAGNKTGLKLRTDLTGDREYTYETFYVYDFYVGYSGHSTIYHDKIKVGWLARLGIACGDNTGGGTGGEGTNSTGAVSVQATQTFNAHIMPPFWMPTTTLGIIAGPNNATHPILSRMEFTAVLTLGLKNIYTDYAKVDYSVATRQTIESGTAQYEGMPLQLQVGASYRLFRFANNNYY